MKKYFKQDWIDFGYCLIVCLCSLLGWSTNSLLGMSLILILCIVGLFYLKDFKYMIPCTLGLFLSNNKGFETEAFPTLVFIIGGIFFICLFVFVILNRKNFRKPKFFWGIGLLSISCFLPILWNRSILEGKEMLYVMFFSYFLFLLIYLLFSINLQKGSFSFLCKAMLFIGLLVSIECLLMCLRLHILYPGGNPMDFWYYLGWGLCNEAGIIMCLTLPFVFVLLYKTHSLRSIIIYFLAMSVIFCGIIYSGSRAAFLFGMCEFFFMTIWVLIWSKERLKIISSFAVIFLSIVVTLQCTLGIYEVIKSILTYTFRNKLGDNNRVELWKLAVLLWKSNPLTILLGNGVVSSFQYRISFNGFDNVFVVYHSTFYEALCSFGLIGILFLCVHFFEKYLLAFKCGYQIGGFLIIGYFFLDLYGLVDNTYGMYYFMIPLMIIMASISSDDELSFSVKKCLAMEGNC